MRSISTVEKVTTYNFYINGQWRESNSGQTIDISSPYSGDVIGKVQVLTREEVDEAIRFAQEAQKSWRETSLQERAECLYNWADELINMQDEIAEVIMQEVGKS